MFEAEEHRDVDAGLSGIGWKRLDDASYLWQQYKKDEPKVVSEQTFKALQKLRRIETLFAVFTLWPVFPMTIFFLKGHLSGWILMGGVICLAFPNYIVNRYIAQKQRRLLLTGTSTSQAVSFLPMNVFLVFSLPHLRKLLWLSAFTCFACVYVLSAFVPGFPLTKPPENINPYTTVVVLIAAATILHLTRRELRKRLRPER